MSDEPIAGDPALLPYRPCVGIMLINADRLVWVGRRRNIEAGESWQMPQGGIDEGEEPGAAAVRELAEETGTDKAELIAETALWLHYDLPPAVLGTALKGKYRGQRQKWCALRFTGVDADFNVDAPPGGHEPEFDAWRWVAADELPGLIVPFKRHIYKAVIAEFSHLLTR